MRASKTLLYAALLLIVGTVICSSFADAKEFHKKEKPEVKVIYKPKPVIIKKIRPVPIYIPKPILVKKPVPYPVVKTVHILHEKRVPVYKNVYKTKYVPKPFPVRVVKIKHVPKIKLVPVKVPIFIKGKKKDQGAEIQSTSYQTQISEQEATKL